MTSPVAGAVSTALDSMPVLSTLMPARRRWQPHLSGISKDARVRRHVALTFDDGPDRTSTPYFLDLLVERGVHATFFLLGAHLAAHGEVVERMVADGHEVAVHGWDHRATPFTRPRSLASQLWWTAHTLRAMTGRPIRWYRPAYGVLTRAARGAAEEAGLTPVLWSAWGRDWEAGATPTRIVTTVQRHLEPGGTVLLHDTDRTSAPDSWRSTLEATRILLDDWSTQGLRVGSLSEHHLAPTLAS